jgi:quercetin dioxygenase-like cupin family protein
MLLHRIPAGRWGEPSDIGDAAVFLLAAIGALHSHPHVQASFVAEGRFEVTIDGISQTLEQGGTFIVPSGLTHGVRALEKGRLVDSFAPARQDFISN